MAVQVFRYEVPVDDSDHPITMTSRPILKVGARRTDRVEFWALEEPGEPDVTRIFSVFGTGHVVPDGYRYVGTPEPVADGMLVWHLFEKAQP